VTLAHAACGPSQIITAGPAAAPSLPDISDMRSLPAVLAYDQPPRYRALLILEPRAELTALTSSGEVASAWISALLRDGMTLMPGAGHLPAPAPGWALRFRRRAARLTAPDGAVIYHGECQPPRGWHDVAAENRAAVTLIGSIGLHTVPDADMTAARLTAMLNCAAATGMLAGALITPRR